MNTFIPSPLQQAIFDAIERGDENIIINAGAGCAKTTTIVEGTKRIQPQRGSLLAPSTVFLAFNKSIADTLRTKLPRSVQSCTFHSLGRRALVDSGLIDPKLTRSRDWVDGRKCSKWVYNALGRENPDVKGVLQLVSLAKSRNPHEEIVWNDIVRFYEISLENPQKAFDVAAKVLEKSDSTLDVIDFDDMLRLPVLFNCKFEPQDWIFVDEAQDTNDVQLEILTRLQKPGKTIFEYDYTKAGPNIGSSPTRLVAVGDPNQAIYGFRGANSDSMDRIAKRFSCVTYPLSVSYRCPKAVVMEAQRYLR